MSSKGEDVTILFFVNMLGSPLKGSMILQGFAGSQGVKSYIWKYQKGKMDDTREVKKTLKALIKLAGNNRLTPESGIPEPPVAQPGGRGSIRCGAFQVDTRRAF